MNINVGKTGVAVRVGSNRRGYEGVGTTDRQATEKETEVFVDDEVGEEEMETDGGDVGLWMG